MEHRFGFVALVGVPNVGKSTLLNRLVGEKLAITSRRPQTTRHRILGIVTEPEYQIVFMDTPGLHCNDGKGLNRRMVSTAIRSMSDADLILYMIDHQGWTRRLKDAFRPVRDQGIPVVLLINKIDRLPDKSRLLPMIEDSRAVHPFEEIIPISALQPEDPERLKRIMARLLPRAPCGFPDDQVTDRSEMFLASELVREQAYLLLGQELPYAIMVELSRFQVSDKGVLCVDAVIWVEKPGQKRIVIGRNGSLIKRIGIGARKQMEQVFARKVFLNLWVTVPRGAGERELRMRSLGYAED